MAEKRLPVMKKSRQILIDWLPFMVVLVIWFYSHIFFFSSSCCLSMIWEIHIVIAHTNLGHYDLAYLASSPAFIYLFHGCSSVLFWSIRHTYWLLPLCYFSHFLLHFGFPYITLAVYSGILAMSHVLSGISLVHLCLLLMHF